jgi:hypothetical protein
MKTNPAPPRCSRTSRSILQQFQRILTAVPAAAALLLPGPVDAAPICPADADPSSADFCGCNLSCGMNATCPSEGCEEKPPPCLALVRLDATGYRIEHTYCLGATGQIDVGPPSESTLTVAESHWLYSIGGSIKLVSWPPPNAHRVVFGRIYVPPLVSATSITLPADGWTNMPDLDFNCGGGSVAFQFGVTAFLAPEKQCRATIAKASHCLNESCRSGVVEGDPDAGRCSAAPAQSARSSAAGAMCSAVLLGACTWVVRRRLARQPR